MSIPAAFKFLPGLLSYGVVVSCVDQASAVRVPDVRIYTYRLPACSVEHFTVQEIDGRPNWRLRAQLHDGRPPLLPIHRKLAYGRLATDDPWNATHFYIPAPFFLWDDSWYHGLEACQADPDRVLQDHQRLIANPGDLPDLRRAALHCSDGGCVFGLWMQFAEAVYDVEGLEAQSHVNRTHSAWILRFYGAAGRTDFGLRSGCPIIRTEKAVFTAACDPAKLANGDWHHIGGYLSDSAELLVDFIPLEIFQSLDQTGEDLSWPRGWRVWGIDLWRRRSPKPTQTLLQTCASPSPMESSSSPCLQRVIDFVEAQPWLQRRGGWDHVVLFAGVDYPRIFNPTHPPEDKDFVLEKKWPAFKNFVVLHFGARTERCMDRMALSAISAFGNQYSPGLKECERRLFQTVTIPPAFPNEDFNCRKVASNVQAGLRPHRLAYRGLTYNAMIERSSVAQAASEAWLQQLQLTGDFRLEFTNWTHDLLRAGACRPAFAFDRLCSWSRVNRPRDAKFNQMGSERVDRMRSRAQELWASTEAGLVLPGDGGYELRLYSMLNKAVVPFIVSARGSSHGKIPFPTLLPWRRFAVFWDLAHEHVQYGGDPTQKILDLHAGAYQLLLQAALMRPEVIQQKRRNLLRYAPSLTWEDHVRCPGMLKKNALDLLAQELAHRLSRYKATGGGLTIGRDWFWKIPDDHLSSSESEDLTGTGCPSGYPLCEKHDLGGNICVAPWGYTPPFACPLGCKLVASGGPPCRTSAGAVCNLPADGSVAIPCGTYPHKNLQSQALPFPDQIVRRPRIALLTWSDRHEISKLTLPSLERLCEEHPGRYDLIVEQESILGPEYAPAWNKVAFLRRILRTPLYDAVVWIDDDILITDPARDPMYEGLKRSILQLHSNVFLYASKDVRVDERVPMNTGILGLRNARRARKFLEDLLRISKQRVVLQGQAFVPRNEGWWDQDAVAVWVQKNGLADAYLEEHGRIQSIVRDVSNGHWQPGDFAAHFSGRPSAVRLGVLQQFLRKRLHETRP